MLELRKYQQDAVKFLEEHERAIIADAPGLGKTFVASEAARPHGKVMVICPTYLVEQWAEFLECQYPEDTIAVARGDVVARSKALEQGAKWVIANTEMLRSYYLPDADVVIFDEMHYLRNRQAEQSKWGAKYAQRVKRVIGLTATPIYKDVSNLWHLLHILDPKSWKSYWNFQDIYCKVIKTGWADKVVGIKNKALLDYHMNKYMLGRTYKQVGMALPEMIEKNVHIVESVDWYKRYKVARDEYRIDDIPLISAGSVLHTLRRMTLTKSKIDAVKSVISDVPDGQPVVVFCWYKDTAAQLAAELKTVPIDGDIPPAERAALAKSQTIRVATLASLSEGVDLSDARTVITVEEDYIPGRMYQAISRVRRHSYNTAPVVVYSVRIKGSVDDTVHKAVRDRISNAHTILKEALA